MAFEEEGVENLSSRKRKCLPMSEEDKKIIEQGLNKYFPNSIPVENRLGFGVYVKFSNKRKEAFVVTVVLDNGALAVGLIMPVSGKATNRFLGFSTIHGPVGVSDWSSLTALQKQEVLPKLLTGYKHTLSFAWRWEVVKDELMRSQEKRLGRKLTKEEKKEVTRKVSKVALEEEEVTTSDLVNF